MDFTLAIFFISLIRPIQMQEEGAPVPSVCNPLMPLELYNAFSEFKNLCVCIANEDYNACTAAADAAGDADAIVVCGVLQCQDYNWCEIQNPCAQTAPPGIQILDCSTTEKHYPTLSTISRQWNRKGLPEESVVSCLAKMMYPPALKAYLDVVKGVINGAVGQTP